MTATYEIRHRTSYVYSESAAMSYNRAHLKPRPCPGQRLLEHAMEVAPMPTGPIHDRVDYFGNPVCYFSIQEPHDAMEVRVRSKVELSPALPCDVDATPAWDRVRDCVHIAYDEPGRDALQYVYPSPYIPIVPALGAMARDLFTPGRPILAAAMDLAGRIHSEFEYDPTATTLATPIEEVCAKRRGVCQDFAQVQIACLRSLGLPARYVSGYILPKGDHGQALVGSLATHAWLSVYTVSNGWVDIDPTHNVIPSSYHITMAWGRDYDEVSPLRGVMLGGGQQELSVDVSIAACEA